MQKFGNGFPKTAYTHKKVCLKTSFSINPDLYVADNQFEFLEHSKFFWLFHLSRFNAKRTIGNILVEIDFICRKLLFGNIFDCFPSVVVGKSEFY